MIVTFLMRTDEAGDGSGRATSFVPLNNANRSDLDKLLPCQISLNLIRVPITIYCIQIKRCVLYWASLWEEDAGRMNADGY